MPWTRAGKGSKTLLNSQRRNRTNLIPSHVALIPEAIAVAKLEELVEDNSVEEFADIQGVRVL